MCRDIEKKNSIYTDFYFCKYFYFFKYRIIILQLDEDIFSIDQNQIIQKYNFWRNQLEIKLNFEITVILKQKIILN